MLEHTQQCTRDQCLLLVCWQVLIERGVSFSSALEKLNQDTSPGEGFYLSKRVGHMHAWSHCPCWCMWQITVIVCHVQCMHLYFVACSTLYVSLFIQ